MKKRTKVDHYKKYPIWKKVVLLSLFINVALMIMVWSPCIILGFFNGEACIATGWLILFTYYPFVSMGSWLISSIISVLSPIMGRNFIIELIAMSIVGFLGFLLLTIMVLTIAYIWKRK